MWCPRNGVHVAPLSKINIECVIIVQVLLPTPDLLSRPFPKQPAHCPIRISDTLGDRRRSNATQLYAHLVGKVGLFA
jgi:hypothetical protein